MILHVTPVADHVPGEPYRAASLDTEGFVHCSDFGTVHLPANRLFAGRTDLMVLVIDPAALDVPVRWEPGAPLGPDGVWFRHVYGPIPAAAVAAVHDFPPTPDGFASHRPSPAGRGPLSTMSFGLGRTSSTSGRAKGDARGCRPHVPELVWLRHNLQRR